MNYADPELREQSGLVKNDATARNVVFDDREAIGV